MLVDPSKYFRINSRRIDAQLQLIIIWCSKQPEISGSLCLSSLLLFFWFWNKYFCPTLYWFYLHKFLKVIIKCIQSGPVSHTIIESWEWNSLISNLVGQKFKEFCFDLTGLSFDCRVDGKVQWIFIKRIALSEKDLE